MWHTHSLLEDCDRKFIKISKTNFFFFSYIFDYTSKQEEDVLFLFKVAHRDSVSSCSLKTFQKKVTFDQFKNIYLTFKIFFFLYTFHFFNSIPEFLFLEYQTDLVSIFCRSVCCAM